MNRFLPETKAQMLGWMTVFILLSVLMMGIWSRYRAPSPENDLAISAARHAFYVGAVAHAIHATCVLSHVSMPGMTGEVQERIFAARHRIFPQMTCDELSAIERGE
jgi:hypothetical protein